MPTPSATTLVNAASVTGAVSVTAGSTVTLTLASTYGVRSVAYSIVGSDDATVAYPTITPGSSFSATFVMPTGYGQGYLVQTVINGGVDDLGRSTLGYTHRYIIGVPINGVVPAVLGETTERGTDGWLPVLNETIRGDYELASPRAYSNALNDEFDTDTLASGWAAYQPFTGAAATISLDTVDAYDTAHTAAGTVRVNVNPARRPSWMLIQAPDDGNATAPDRGYVIHKSVTLPTNVIVWARLKFGRIGATLADSSIGLCLGASSGSLFDHDNQVAVWLNNSAAGPVPQARLDRVDAGVHAVVGTSSGSGLGLGGEHVVIHKRGTVYHGWAGTNGGNWFYLGSYTHASTLNRVGICVLNTGVDAPGVCVAGVDFVRFITAENFLL